MRKSLLGPLRLLIIGSPGSGKGTMSEWLGRDFQLSQISSGDILRKHIAAGSEIGNAVSKILIKGELVGDEIMVKLVMTEINNKFNENILLDGFPRTIGQATELDKQLAVLKEGQKHQDGGHKLSLVLNLDVPPAAIIERVKDRWVHTKSGRVYNLKFNPPKVPGLDDITGEKLSKRPDDNEETIKARLAKFEKETAPLLKIYEKKGILRSFQGETSKGIYPHLKKEVEKLFQ